MYDTEIATTHYIEKDNSLISEAPSDVILQLSLQTQDLGKETVINYLHWLPCPCQNMHLLAFLFKCFCERICFNNK